MDAQSSHHSSLKITIIVVVAVLLAALAAFIVYQNMSGKDSGGTGLDTIGSVADSLENLEEQDKAYGKVTNVSLSPKDPSTEGFEANPVEVKKYSGSEQQTSKQEVGGGVITPIESYQIDKPSASADSKQPSFFTSYVVYGLDEEAKKLSTNEVVRAQLESRVKTAKQQYEKQFTEARIVASQPEALDGVTISTATGENIRLAAGKFNINVDNIDGQNQQSSRVSFIVSAAKLGDRLVVARFANLAETSFGSEANNFKEMLSLMQLSLTQ